MADAFKFNGSYETDPLGSATSFAATVIANINEARTLVHKQLSDIDLTVDAPVAIAFGGVTNAHAVLLKATGGKVKARLTSADGATQSIPFDSYLIVFSEAVPFTAIDLTRVAGVTTSVRAFLGEKS
jgi:hypothetical protein